MKLFRTAYADTKASSDASTSACAYAGINASANTSADVNTDRSIIAGADASACTSADACTVANTDAGVRRHPRPRLHQDRRQHKHPRKFHA